MKEPNGTKAHKKVQPYPSNSECVLASFQLDTFLKLSGHALMVIVRCLQLQNNIQHRFPISTRDPHPNDIRLAYFYIFPSASHPHSNDTQTGIIWNQKQWFNIGFLTATSHLIPATN